MCRFRVSVFVWTHVYGWVSEVFSEWRVCVCVSAVKCEVVSESMAMKEKQERKLYSIPSGVRVPGISLSALPLGWITIPLPLSQPLS